MRKDIGVISSAGQALPGMFAKRDYCLPKFSGIVGRMESDLDWARLGRYVRSERGPRSQKDVAESGGPSDETISKIERGQWRPQRSVKDTLDKLDAGLGWPAGSADRVLRGGEPIPRVDPVLDSRPDPVPPEQYPIEVLAMAAKLWGAVNELSESPEGDALRPRKAETAILAAADLLVDVLLALNAGPPAKPLIQEMSNRAYEVLQLDQERTNELEADEASGTSAQTGSAEKNLDGVEATPLGDLAGDSAAEDRAQQGE